MVTQLLLILGWLAILAGFSAGCLGTIAVGGISLMDVLIEALIARRVVEQNWLNY